jgi:DNA-binding transcriptional MerR regulator
MVHGLQSDTKQRMRCVEMRLMRIGEFARLSDLPLRTVQYYEKRGLVEPAEKTEAGYRLYGEEELARLWFVRRAKLLGLALEEIRELVSLAAGRNRGEIVPCLKDVPEVQLEKTERGMKEPATSREGLLYYRKRPLEEDPGRTRRPRRASAGA